MIKFLRKQVKKDKRKISTITVIKENRKTVTELISRRRIRRLHTFNLEINAVKGKTSLSRYFEGVEGLMAREKAYRA